MPGAVVSVVVPSIQKFGDMPVANQQITCVCGEKYWPAQRWIHVNHQEVASNVVVNRRRDRHKKSDARRRYMAEYMRKRRGHKEPE
jgi:hypothetical protein